MVMKNGSGIREDPGMKKAAVVMTRGFKILFCSVFSRDAQFANKVR